MFSHFLEFSYFLCSFGLDDCSFLRATVTKYHKFWAGLSWKKYLLSPSSGGYTSKQPGQAPTEICRRNSFLASHGFPKMVASPWHLVVCMCLIPVSASVTTGCSSPLYLLSSYKDTDCIVLRAHCPPMQTYLIPANYICSWPHF